MRVASYAVGPTARTVVGPSAACCIRRFKRVDCVASPIVGRSMAVSKLPFRKRKYRKLVAMLAAVAFGIFAVLSTCNRRSPITGRKLDSGGSPVDSDSKAGSLASEERGQDGYGSL